MGNLKPCPFCGCNAAVLEREQFSGPILYKIVCNSKKCRGHDHAGNVGAWMENGWRESREEAAELWNRRTERTCRKVPGRMKYGRRISKCSECGYSLGDSRYVYCPNCGARVMEEDE